MPGLNDLGLDPTSTGYLKSDVTDLTRSLADKNTKAGLSLVARLLDQHQRGQTGIQDNLAERGIFRSGATPSMLGHEALQYKQAGSDARGSLLDTIMGTIGSYTTGEQARQAALRQGALEAWQRARDAQGDTPPAGDGAHAPPATSTTTTTTGGTATKKRKVPNPWTYKNIRGGV